MNIIHLIEEKTLSVSAKVLEVLAKGINYNSFELELKKELDNLGCDILKVVIESLEQKIFNDDDRKRDWVPVRKDDPKGILTPFGMLEFKRRYYRNRRSGEYSYLVDQKLGITPHMRVGTNLKAELVEACSERSYEASTLQIGRYNPEIKLSRQTAANCVKEFRAKRYVEASQKRKVAELFIEADEDHIKVRRRKGAQARLIYVHEGVQEQPRRHLKNVKHFTTVDKTPEEFWVEVCDYIAGHYELTSIKSIYLSGDGAKWIQSGKEYIPGVTYILDKFHLAKYIISATAHKPELRRSIYKAIQRLDKETVLAKLNEALATAEKPARQKRILNTIRYFKNNWDGIEASVKNPHVGCSAEGHVSHILSARLSSRPMAWSLKGAGNMASMRAIRANKESVREHYLASLDTTPAITELEHETRRELTQVRSKMQGKEYFSNIPLFNGGSSLVRTALRGINGKMIV